MVPKRVCILTLGVGSGHLRASEAVQRALYDGYDPIEAKVVGSHSRGAREACGRVAQVHHACTQT